jgi:hypothetical protein
MDAHRVAAEIRQRRRDLVAVESAAAVPVDRCEDGPQRLSRQARA